MKKSTGVLGIVVILGVVYTGASWYVGKQAQATIEQAVDQANQGLAGVLGADMGGNDAKLAIDDYRRGLFSSDVMVTLQVKGSDGKPLEFKLRDHLQHGPFPIGSLRSGDLTPMLALSNAVLIPSAATQAWFDSLKGEPPLTIVSEVGFAGVGHSQWRFQPLNLSDDGDSLAFSGGNVDIDFSNNYKNSTTTGQFDSLSVIAAATGENLQVKGIKLNSKTTSSAENRSQLQSSAAVDSFVMTSNESQPVHIKQMTVSINSTRTDNLLDGEMRYDLAQVAVGSADLGSISAGIKGRRFDVDALGKLVAEYDAIKAAHGVADDEDFELTDAEGIAMREKLMAVLASGPTISLDPFAWKNDKGQSAITLNVDLMHPADDQAADAGIDSFLSKIIKLAKLDVSISRPMFIQAFGQAQGAAADNPQAQSLGGLLFDQYAGRLSQAGLMKMDGDNAVAAIKYEKNRIDANGQDMPVSEFLQRALILAM